MKQYLALILALGLFVFANTAMADDRADATVTVANFSFTNQTVTINAGEKVTWNNTSGFHNVASTDDTTFRCGSSGCDQSGGNGSPGSGWTAEFTFNTPGRYNYVCQIHSSMTGTVVVNGPNAVGLDAMNASGNVSHLPLWLFATLLSFSGIIIYKKVTLQVP